MAPCELEQRETVGNGITVSMYRIWQNCGGGYDIVVRNGTDLERVHTRSLRQADEAFAMLVGKYSGMDAEARETMYAYAEQWQASREADDLYATLAELDSAADARAMADYMAHWYAEQDYRDLRDTQRCAF